MIFPATKVTQDFLTYELLFCFWTHLIAWCLGSGIFRYFSLSNIFICIFIISFLHLISQNYVCSWLVRCEQTWDIFWGHLSIRFISITCTWFRPYVKYFVFQEKVKSVCSEDRKISVNLALRLVCLVESPKMCSKIYYWLI